MLPPVAVHNAANKVKSFGRRVNPAKHTRAGLLLTCGADVCSCHLWTASSQHHAECLRQQPLSPLPWNYQEAHLLLPSSGRPQICCMPLLQTVSSGSWAGSWLSVPLLLLLRLLSIAQGWHVLLGWRLMLSVLLLGQWLLFSITLLWRLLPLLLGLVGGCVA